MGQESTIEWTDGTWTIVQGCDPVSPGCANCYVPRVLIRHASNPNPKISLPVRGLVTNDGRLRFTGEVALREDRMNWPLKWRKPMHIFVPSHGDLFHEKVPTPFIDRVFAVMAICQRHQFQVLTKRIERCAEYLNDPGLMSRLAFVLGESGIDGALGGLGFLKEGSADGNMASVWGSRFHSIVKKIGHKEAVSWWPLPNIWIGASVEDQKRADERIPHLLRCPAAVRFLSVEPLLEGVNLFKVKDPEPAIKVDFPFTFNALSRKGGIAFKDRVGLDWIIVGGESGTGARPLNVEWIRSIVRQCELAWVPVFVKQLGADAYSDTQCFCGRNTDGHWKGPSACFACAGRLQLRDPKGGEMAEWPEDLRVRQMPGEAVAR